MNVGLCERVFTIETKKTVYILHICTFAERLSIALHLIVVQCSHLCENYTELGCMQAVTLSFVRHT